MNIKTLYDQVRSKLSNHDPQLTDVSADQYSTTESDAIPVDHNRTGSVSATIDNAENNNDDDATKASNEVAAIGAVTVAAAGSTFSKFKTIINKSVATVKDSAANLDMAGSVTDSAKNALKQGTDAFKEATTKLSVPDSVTGAAKNIFDKSMDAIKSPKAVVDSEESLADQAENILSRNNNIQPEASAESIDSTLQVDEQLTRNIVEANGVDTTPVIEDIAPAIENDDTQTISDIGEETISELIGNIEQTTAAVADEIEVPTLGTRTEHTNEEVKTTEDHVSVVNHARLPDTVDDTVKTVAVDANEVLTISEIDMDNTDSVSSLEQAEIGLTDSTTGVVIAAESTTLEDYSIEDSPDAIGLDSSSSLAARDSSELDSHINQTDHDANRDIENAAPGSASYDDERIGAIASTGTSVGRWILPMVLLALVGAVIWWLTTYQGKQPSDEMTASLNKTINTDQSQTRVVTPKTDLDGSSPAKKLSLNPETTNVTGDIKSVKNDISANVNSDQVTKKGSVQTGIDTLGNNKTADINTVRSAGAMQTIDTARAVADKNNVTTTIRRTSQSGSPVDAISRFLESGDAVSEARGFILYGLSYKIDSSDISENSTNSTKIIADLASVLKTYPNINIRLEGHTDSRGDADANLALSAARANTIKSQLVDLGIAPARIATIGLGEEDPIMDNETEAWQSKNRRVEVIVIDQ